MDATVQRYNEIALAKEKIPEELTHAMRAGAKEKTRKLNVKMTKLVIVANPTLKLGFLAEVCFIM